MINFFTLDAQSNFFFKYLNCRRSFFEFIARRNNMRGLFLCLLAFCLVFSNLPIASAASKSESLNQGPAYLFTHPTGWMWRHVELCRTLKGISKYEKTLQKLSWNDWKELKSGNRGFSNSNRCQEYGKIWGEYFEQSLSLISELAQKGIHPKSKRANVGVELEANQFAMEGVRIVGVTPGGLAELAGLQSGDVLLKVGNWKIYRKRDVLLLAYLLVDEPEVEIIYSRNNIPSITTIK